jgi:ParB family transcriptional regulator, chromosome partitioning protein
MVEIVNALVMVETRRIKPYHRNPRRNDATVDKLVELIPKVGFNVPLVLDRNNVIVKGHTRWKAAVRLKMAALPCVYTDADEETIKLDRLADNRVQEFSSWDQELLGGELASLNLDFAFDLGTLDFVLADNRRRPPGLTGEPAAPSGAGAPGESGLAAGEREDDRPFISDDDVRATASLPVNEYHEVTCNKCGNRMFVKKDGLSRQNAL